MTTKSSSTLSQWYDQRPQRERIVLLVGQADDLTPAPGGLALGRDWGLPEANFLVRPQGHFSVWFGLLSDPRPLARLSEILEKSR